MIVSNESEGLWKESWRYSVRIVDIPAAIQTEHLVITSRKGLPLKATIQFGVANAKTCRNNFMLA
jgi:hypothetical protein